MHIAMLCIGVSFWRDSAAFNDIETIARFVSNMARQKLGLEATAYSSGYLFISIKPGILVNASLRHLGWKLLCVICSWNGVCALRCSAHLDKESCLVEASATISCMK